MIGKSHGPELPVIKEDHCCHSERESAKSIKQPRNDPPGDPGIPVAPAISAAPPGGTGRCFGDILSFADIGVPYK
jgi:hypothetical protein